MPVPDFSPGEVLTAAAMDSISSWKLADVDFTTSALVEVENVFSANYDHYELILTVIGSAATNHDLRFHTAVNTPTTASNYFRYGFYLTAGGTFINFQSNSLSSLFLNNHSTGAGVISSTRATVMSPFNNASRTHFYHQAYDSQSGLYINLMHQWVDNTRFTGFRVIPASGTLTGNIQVRGWRA
jgi:hypothetical protein